MAKILLLDIENAPNLAHVWKLWKENIQLDRLLEPKYTLSYAAKWYGSDKMFFDSLGQSSQRKMIRGVRDLLDEADLVVHYNGKRHDIPIINTEIAELNIDSPSPYRQVDLLTTVKSKFSFPSNRLAYVAKRLGVGEKLPTPGGHKVWIGCMEDQAWAWKIMKNYNIHDVNPLLEGVYNKLRPWVKDHPNVAIYGDGDSLGCPVCGGKQHWLSDKPIVTKNLKYPLYQCRSCKTWYRGTKSLGPKSGEKYATI